ncbi:hypothetical protein IMZ48_38365, partial [Candidatus Bathyarchaeota archaeon]|nr:hypothetical protein [Candidatus Bathyarchaeota archaeon]
MSNNAQTTETRRCGGCRTHFPIACFTRSSNAYGPILDDFRSCNYCKIRKMKGDKQTEKEFARKFLGLGKDGSGTRQGDMPRIGTRAYASAPVPVRAPAPAPASSPASS